MAPPTKRQRKRGETKYETKDWKWLLWDSDLAREKIHPELGAGWTAVLKEACCLRAGVHKDKVNRLRKKGDRGPLRLWPTQNFGRPFKDMVVRIPLLEWCVRRKYKPSAATFEATARGGDMDAIKWLRKEKCAWEGWKWDEDFEVDFHDNACDGAAEGGQLHVLKWLRTEGCPWGPSTCSAAARGGHLDVLKWLRKDGSWFSWGACPWEGDTCSNAAWGGYMHILKYAHENGCPWDESTCAYAAMRGHLAVLKYARENGCPWDEETCEHAARGGLDVLKYAHKNRCPWDERTCAGAADGGHLDVLKYAINNGCPWDSNKCFQTAKDYGHQHIADWILSQIEHS